MPSSGLMASPSLGIEYGVGTGLFSLCLAMADWKVDSRDSRRSKISSTLSTEMAMRLPHLAHGLYTNIYRHLDILALIPFIAILAFGVIRFFA
jgi:hypothetical protein